MDEGPGRAQRIAGLLLTLAMLWMMLPEHQRTLILMRGARLAQHAAHRAARREGQAGMGDELGGRPGDAARRYSLAYTLARVRDRAGLVLEQLRP
jgi:hypothetical protein